MLDLIRRVIGGDVLGYPHLHRERRKSVFPKLEKPHEDLEQAASSRAVRRPRSDELYARRDRHHLNRAFKAD